MHSHRRTQHLVSTGRRKCRSGLDSSRPTNRLQMFSLRSIGSAMGFATDRLMGKALLALEEVVQEARYRPVRRSLALRLALAYLWSLGSGDRAPFDDLWRHLAAEDGSWRFSCSDNALSAIYRELGVQRDPEVSMRMWHRAAAIFRPIDRDGIPLPVDPPPP